MLRYSSNDIVEVGRLTSGTSAQFIGYNIKTGKKGIYKANGCILGIENDDIREKLSSDILSTIGVSTASIDLIFDEQTGQNTYFSNYVISDSEELVAPDNNGCESESPNPIENMCERYLQGVRKLTNDEQFIEAARKNFYQYTYLCCMLDCYDIKPDNLPLVYNKESNMLSMAPYFDFGTAFYPEHKYAAIYEMSTDEILVSLFDSGYEGIKDIVHKVNTELTPEKISELFSSEYVTENLGKDEIDKIRTRFMSQIEKSREYEDKYKLKSLGYDSVADMNADDQGAEMFKRLHADTYPPQAPEIVEYDNAYPERNIDKHNIAECTIEGQ